MRMRWGFMAWVTPYEYEPTSATEEGFARSGMVVKARIKLTIIVVRNPPLGHLHSKCLLRAGYSFRSSATTLIEVEIDETQREDTDADKVGNTTRLYEAQQQAAARLREVGEEDQQAPMASGGDSQLAPTQGNERAGPIVIASRSSLGNHRRCQAAEFSAKSTVICSP